MKVLERKDWKQEWRSVCTCSQCQSKLEADIDDLKCNLSSGGNMHDYTPEYFYIVCEVCSQQLAVATGDVPDYVKKIARDKANNEKYIGR